MASKRKMYLVVQHVSADRYGVFAGVKTTDAGTVVLACDNEAKALAQARILEAEARQLLPPFHAGSPDHWSSLGLPALVAKLEALGLRDLPGRETDGWAAGRHWRRWWDQYGGDLTAEQVEAIWTLLDQVQLYQVVEVAVKG